MPELDVSTFSERERDMLSGLAELTGRIFWLLDKHNLWPEGTYTFPDGDTWTKEEYQRYLVSIRAKQAGDLLQAKIDREAKVIGDGNTP
jgi:hypothetical protein